MSRQDMLRFAHLPPDLAKQVKDSVEEAFLSLGGATAALILHYARSRHDVDISKLPDGIEELDNALKEILGTGRRMVVNHCSELLSRRLGKEIRAKADSLSDMFRQVVKIYQKRGLTEREGAYLTGKTSGPGETIVGDNAVEGLLRE